MPCMAAPGRGWIGAPPPITLSEVPQVEEPVMTPPPTRRRRFDFEPLIERIMVCCISSLAVASVMAVVVLSVLGPLP
jgi:hypothetical protein